MNFWTANFFDKKGQLKIQEMAFVLVAFMVFFAIVAIFYINIRVSNLRGDVELQRGEEAKELVKKLSTSAEFSWTASQCSNCIDLDKVMVLKDKIKSSAYSNFWNLDYLDIEVVYPEKTGECTRDNYPECGSIILINKSNYAGTTKSAFVSLCRFEFKQQAYTKCELGRILAAGERIK